MQKLTLTDKWDKTFPQDARVRHEKVTFHNRYGITLAADLYAPKGETGPFAAIAVCGPFGAVKEQSSGLYAQEMAIRGFLTIAFDPSFTGESGGEPRNVASPDINTEDFQAAVDYLSTRPDVDPERIGIIGICGWGGMALNAAAIDTRIKATAAMTTRPLMVLTQAASTPMMDRPAEGEKGERRNGKVPCGHNTTPHMAKLSNQPIGRTGIIIDVYAPDGANSIGQTDGHSTSDRASMM